MGVVWIAGPETKDFPSWKSGTGAGMSLYAVLRRVQRMVQADLGPMSSRANSSSMAVKSVQVKHKLCRKMLEYVTLRWCIPLNTNVSNNF